MSHIAITYHLVFGTYQRIPAITAEHERELYKYIFTFSTERGVFIRRIGGMPDHIHILCDIPPKFAVADFVKLLKSESSKFMRVNPHFPLWSRWAEGYGAFSIDNASIGVRMHYIASQKEHHKRLSFAEEYRKILSESGFSSDTPILGDITDARQG